MSFDRYFYIALLSLSCVVGALATESNLTYDANGNLVTGDGKYRVYNSLNQLWKVYNGSTNTTLLQEYVYDPIEERVAVKRTYNSSGSTTETIYYFSEEFARVVNSSGTFDFTYVYHERQFVAQNNGSTTFFIHGNHEGSSSVVTNSSGGVLERVEYGPYGERLNSSSVRFGYEAEEHDAILGDVDFDARRYKQDWALFETPDSLIANVYRPQMLNRYMFELGSPYRYKDESGHAPSDQWLPFLPTRPVGASPTDNAGGLLVFGDEANRLYNIGQMAKQSQYQAYLTEFKGYYCPGMCLTLTFGNVATASSLHNPPSYEELEEWFKIRRMTAEQLQDEYYSLELSNTISTPKTYGYSSFGRGNYYDAIASLGGTVSIRSRGISKGLVSVYYREDSSGKKIQRYQHHKDKESKNEWEDNHPEYRSYG